MVDYRTLPLREGLESLHFDIKDAYLKVQRDRPIDMSGIDERIEYFCEEIIKQPQEIKDDVEPLMTEIISGLEGLAHALQDAIDSDKDDWDDDHSPENHHSQ